MLTEDLLITNASQLLTVAGPAPRVGSAMRDLGIVSDGALLIRNGLIEAVGKSADISGRVSAATRRIDARGCVVMPGFVDPHTHLVFAGTREDEYELRIAGMSYQEIASLGGGIRSTVLKTRAATEDELFELARKRVEILLAHGTTTAEVKSGYGLTTEDEVKILRVIRRLNRETALELVPTFLGAHEIPDEFRQGNGRREDYVLLVLEEMLPRVARERLAEFADVFCESHVFSIEETRQILGRAKELGLGIRVHAEQLSFCGGSDLACELSAASADHLEWIDSEGIKRLGASTVTAVLLPGAVFHLGLRRYPPAREMIDSNVALALATDFNPGSSPTPSMQMVLSIACTQMRMTPAEAITAATINGAYSLNRSDRLGSLEPGKQADLVILDCEDYRQIPYFFGVNHVRAVVKRGVRLHHPVSR